MIILQLVFYIITIIMNARRILDIFNCTFLINIKPPLGRWKIHNHKQTILKIKYANEDNCGISGMNYINILQKQRNNQLDDD